MTANYVFKRFDKNTVLLLQKRDEGGGEEQGQAFEVSVCVRG